MPNSAVAILIFGDTHSTRNALEEEKYKKLAIAFQEKGFGVSSVIFLRL